ncbi:MAG: protein kinase domain-containing protein [Thermoanaerobaculia bacterium]
MQPGPGTRLAQYELTTAIGKGGMGEVWRATDTKLGREVAIKVLPEEFTRDAERLARFEREARILASLEHSNIASIYGFEDVDGIRFLAMQLAEGEDLSDRVRRGPIPLDESLAIARQLAEALEAAHEKGVIHRDLKPANIKLGSEGQVKVLDFGLAKAMESDESDGDFLNSPTIVRAATHAGMILGTAAYMSPEQARGKRADKRADVWAFGVVLWEMLTGSRLFAGETVSDTLAEVLKTGIEFDALPAETPAAIRRLLRQCLERNPKNRLHDIADARIAIDDVLAGRGDDVPATSTPTAAATATPTRRSWMLVAICSIVALALGLGAGYLARKPATATSAESKISFERLTFRPGHFVNARFAPDGQTVFLSADWNRHDREVFQVRPNAGELAVGLAGVELLSVSRTGELAVLLPRVENGNPYRMTGTLAVVSASGGTPRELSDGVIGADWAPDGKSLALLREVDGKSRIEFPIGTTLYETPNRIFWIRVSPKGDAVAFFESEASGLLSVVVVTRKGVREVWSAGWADWWNLAWTADGEEIWFGAANAGYAASLYAVNRQGTLRTLLTAPGTLELHDVAADRSVLVALVDVRAQALAMKAGGSLPENLSWLEDSSIVDLSADGSRVLLAVSSEREPDGGNAVYLRSMNGESPTRLGSGKAQQLSPDGKWALAIRGGAIVALPTAAGKERVLETGLTSLREAQWMADGTHALVVGQNAEGQRVASLFDFDGGAPRVIVSGIDLRPGNGQGANLSPVSPDGRVVAVAMASGRIELLPLDGGAPRPLAGSGPNDLPIQWTPDGRQLFVFDPSELPTKVSRIDLATGRREIWREIMPIDRVGVCGIAMVAITPDASAFAYSYRQYFSKLYRVRGLP